MSRNWIVSESKQVNVISGGSKTMTNMKKLATILLAIVMTLQAACVSAQGTESPPSPPPPQLVPIQEPKEAIPTVTVPPIQELNVPLQEKDAPASNTQNTSVAADDGVFTLVALPDTQYYSTSYPGTYNAITGWISNSWNEKNFDFVVHLGDIVNHPEREQEWLNATYAMSLLRQHTYTVLPGNHDYEYGKNGTSNYTNYNKYFTTDILTPHLNKGTFPTGTMINNYVEVKGYLILSIGFYYKLDSALREWIVSTLSQYSHLPVIVVTHDFMLSSGELSVPGKELWSTLKDFPNVFLVLSGHAVTADKLDKHEKVNKLTGANGNTAYAIMSNYQDYMGHNSGYIRIYEITNNYIDVKTFSPLLNTYMVDKSSQFTLAR